MLVRGEWEHAGESGVKLSVDASSLWRSQAGNPVIPI